MSVRCEKAGDRMEIEIKVENGCKEPKIIVITDKITNEINELVKMISDAQPQLITGFYEDNVKIIEPETIIRVYSSGQKVYIQTHEREYTVRLRLYELEQRLDGATFVRISNSEIINLKKAINFDLSFRGTICVKLSNDVSTYVSRRYVSKIKYLLGI